MARENSQLAKCGYFVLLALVTSCTGQIGAQTEAHAPAINPAKPPAPPQDPGPLVLPRNLALYPNLLLPEDTFFHQVSVAQSPHKVFAHYMVALPVFGGPNAGVKGAMQDILMAQSMGLDGFALNAGAWLGNPNYITAATNLFAAAQQLGTGFSLFFSADMTGLGSADILDMMNQFAKHPNYFTVEGRPMLSTYAGNTYHDSDYPNPVDWWKNRILVPLKNQGINVYFVPDFADVPWGSPDTVVSTWSGVVDGLLDWCVLGVLNGDAGNSIANSVNETNSTLLKAAHKTLMAAVVNQYWGSLQTSISRPLHEFQQGAGEELQWKSIINVSQPQWVEILTWNDKEESYMMPVDDFMKYNDWGVPKGYYKPHAGYAELERYYIQWYKTGVQPALTKDSIFYFYRTQSVNMVAGNDWRGSVNWFLPLGSGTDTTYVTVALTSPATLTINSGGTLTTHELVAGINQVQTPFTPGDQSFSLARNGVPINSVQGEPIVTAADLYNYWMTTGFVETAPATPGAAATH